MGFRSRKNKWCHPKMVTPGAGRPPRPPSDATVPIFIVFGLTRPGIEPESTVSVADALSTRLLID